MSEQKSISPIYFDYDTNYSVHRRWRLKSPHEKIQEKIKGMVEFCRTKIWEDFLSDQHPKKTCCAFRYDEDAPEEGPVGLLISSIPTDHKDRGRRPVYIALLLIFQKFHCKHVLQLFKELVQTDANTPPDYLKKIVEQILKSDKENDGEAKLEASALEFPIPKLTSSSSSKSAFKSCIIKSTNSEKFAEKIDELDSQTETCSRLLVSNEFLSEQKVLAWDEHLPGFGTVFISDNPESEIENLADWLEKKKTLFILRRCSRTAIKRYSNA